MNTLKTKCNIAFHYVFAVLFGIITLSAATVICKNIFVVAFAAIGLLLFIYLGNYLYTNKKLPNSRQINIIFAVTMSAMFILQLIFGWCVLSTPITDWGVINKMALNFACDGSFENMYNGIPAGNNGYIARYPNNNGILILLSLYYRAIYLIGGCVPAYAPVVLNTVFIAVAVIFTFLIAKKIFKPVGVLATIAFCFLFMPYYAYTAYYYSDSLSIPFTTMSVYFIIVAAKLPKEKIVKKILLLALAGICVSVGYTLKGSLLVILVGAVVFLVLYCKLKEAVISIASILLAFVICTSGTNAFIKSFNFTTDEELYEQRFPINHWIMMGLNGDGGFHQEDASYTYSAGNYDEKKEADNKRIAERIEKMGVAGMAGHFYKKVSFTWGDGTYWISHHLNSKDENGNTIENRNPLFELVLTNGYCYQVFYVYCNALHLIILVLMVLSAYYATRRKRVTPMTLIRGIVFGVALFFMIWEARSRYLFNFSPLFILTAASGLATVVSRAQLYKNRHQASKQQLAERTLTDDDLL